jgi:hypothetical protein
VDLRILLRAALVDLRNPISAWTACTHVGAPIFTPEPEPEPPPPILLYGLWLPRKPRDVASSGVWAKCLVRDPRSGLTVYSLLRALSPPPKTQGNPMPFFFKTA